MALIFLSLSKITMNSLITYYIKVTQYATVI